MPLSIDWAQDRRIDKWTLEEQPLLREETITVPLSSPYEVELSEIPVPGSVVVRAGSTGSVFVPTGDTYIDEANTGVNHTGDTILAVGRNSADISATIVRSLLQFDFSSGPMVASSAILWIYRALVQAAPLVGVHRVTGPWSAGSANWSNQPAFNLVPSATIQLVANTGGWYSCNITALYNAYQAGDFTDYGLMLRTGEAATGTANNFYSREMTDFQPHIDCVGTGDLYEVVDQLQAPATGECAVNARYGRVRFHSSAAGLSASFRYLGKGTLVDVPRIWADAIPTGSSFPGKPGQITADTSYFYVCVATNTWRRVAIGTF